MSRKIFISTLAFIIALPLTALASPNVSIDITALKEVVEIVNGEPVTRRVPATEVVPGDIVVYTLTAINSGDEPAQNLQIEDPIPQGVSYLPGSATQKDDLSFSIDGGNTFQNANSLDSSETGPRKSTLEKNYTHIRWLIPELAAGNTHEFEFRVKVK